MVCPTFNKSKNLIKIDAVVFDIFCSPFSKVENTAILRNTRLKFNSPFVTKLICMFQYITRYYIHIGIIESI